VTAALQQMKHGEDKYFSQYHHVLNRVRWSLDGRRESATGQVCISTGQATENDLLSLRLSTLSLEKQNSA
jgi:hypothetical protein